MKRLLVIVALAGCATPMSEIRAALDEKAARSLSCPADQLTYEELEKLFSTTRVKISGCGNSAVYEMVESQWKKRQER